MDNTYALESFVNFCDDYQLAEEGVIVNIGKDIWGAIVRIINKLVIWFKNMLLNINYFKTAKLDEQMSNDLMYCLKLAQPKTERTHFQLMPQFYAKIKTLHRSDANRKFDGNKFGVTGESPAMRGTTLNDQLFVAMQDIDATMEAVRKCDAYKRLQENKYQNKNIKEIPLTNIVSDMKNSNSKINTFKGHIMKVESTARKTQKGTPVYALANKMANFYNKVVSYYSMRTSILIKYLERAKASLHAVSSNIKEAIKKQNNGRVDTRYKNKISLKIIDKNMLFDIYTEFRAAVDAETYSDYKPHYDKLIKLLKLKPGYIIDGLGNGIASCRYMESPVLVFVAAIDNREKVVISKDTQLFHTSPNPNIKQLTPTWRTTKGISLFPTPRVYFHTSNPLNRFGNKVSNTDTVYVPKSLPSVGYVDKEMGRTAIYVEADKPIPVEKLDYSAWKKEREIKLGLNDQD